MDITIAQRAMAAYKHVTSTVLNQPDGSPLLKALDNAGVLDILDLLSLTRQQVHSLSYDDNGTMKPVAVAPRNKIITFVAYINYRNNHGTPIGNDYLSVTEAQYDNFRCTEYLRSGNSDLSYPDVNTRIMLKGINPTPKQAGIMDISDTELIPPTTEHDNNGMEQHCSRDDNNELIMDRDDNNEIIMDNTLDEHGKVCDWHMPISYVTHHDLPAKGIHDERGYENPDTVSQQIPLDVIRKQQTIQLFPIEPPSTAPPPEPPPPEPPPRINCKSVDHPMLVEAV